MNTSKLTGRCTLGRTKIDLNEFEILDNRVRISVLAALEFDWLLEAAAAATAERALSEEEMTARLLVVDLGVSAVGFDFV